MTVQNIKCEIKMLWPGEISELQTWLNHQEHDQAAIDLQLKSAVDAGKFDSLIEKAGLTTLL